MSNKDITRFELETALVARLGEQTLQIDGAVQLAPLPPGLSVHEGARKPEYMLHLQAHVFSPSGQVVWSQYGNPTEPWVHRDGGRARFSLIKSYTGVPTGQYGAVVAYGDPIVVTSTSDSRVILGMKWFSLDSYGRAIRYSGPRPAAEGADVPSFELHLSGRREYNAKATGGEAPAHELSYLQKKAPSGWTYTQVVGIAESRRREIFLEYVRYQDRTGDDRGADAAMAKKFGLPLQAVKAITFEGVAMNWPLP